MPQPDTIKELRRLLNERTEAPRRTNTGNTDEPDGFALDDRFAMPYGYTKAPPEKDPFEPRNAEELSGQNKFITEPDLESLAEVAEQTGNQELLNRVIEERTDSVANEFRKRHPEYQPTSDNVVKLVADMGQRHFGAGFLVDDDNVGDAINQLALKNFFTLAELEESYAKLSAEGEIELVPGTTRELTQAEKLKVTRFAQTDPDPSRAVGYYLCYAAGINPEAMTEEEAATEVRDLLENPHYLPMVNEAILFVWELRTYDFQSTPGRVEYLMRFASGRPLSFGLLDAAWKSCKEYESEQGRRLQQVRAQTPSAGDLERLSDDEVASLYSGSLAARGERMREARSIAAQTPEQWIESEHRTTEIE